MIMKIDTQGMSYGTGKGNGKSIEEQRAALPDVEPPEKNPLVDVDEPAGNLLPTVRSPKSVASPVDEISMY